MSYFAAIMSRRIAGSFGGVEWEGRVAREGDADATWEIQFGSWFGSRYYPVPAIPVWCPDDEARAAVEKWFGELTELYERVLFIDAMTALGKCQTGPDLMHWAIGNLPRFQDGDRYVEILDALERKSAQISRP